MSARWCLDVAAGDGRCGRVVGRGTVELSLDEVLQVEQVALAALGDGLQGRHDGDLLDLLLDEPLHELLAEVVPGVPCGLREVDDLLGDRLLLLEGQIDRGLVILELVVGGAGIPGGISTSMSRSRKYCTIIIAWVRSSTAWR